LSINVQVKDTKRSGLPKLEVQGHQCQFGRNVNTTQMFGIESRSENCKFSSVFLEDRLKICSTQNASRKKMPILVKLYAEVQVGSRNASATIPIFDIIEFSED
jgi:hypothetical protein